MPSAQMVGRMLEALYNEGGASFNALFDTSFDDVKIRAGVPKNISGCSQKLVVQIQIIMMHAIVFASKP